MSYYGALSDNTNFGPKFLLGNFEILIGFKNFGIMSFSLVLPQGKANGRFKLVTLHEAWPPTNCTTPWGYNVPF